MINRYDIAYGLGVGLAAPFWLAHPKARRKVLSALSQRMGRVPGRDLSKPAIMIHAVSLGEINATRSLVDLLRSQRSGLHFIISVTTETGFVRGQQIYGSVADVTLVRYPLDFTSAVDRLLGTLRPAVVALLELEVWPNFIRRCAQRGVPVLLINGRITEGSFRKYRLAQPLVGSMFARLGHVAAQDEIYAKRFAELGVPRKRISVTGTMKFDNAPVADRFPGQDELAAAVGLKPGKEPIWVCGSTGPGEEAIVLPIYRRLLKRFADLRLVIVPRKPERFDEVAELIVKEGFPVIRRSRSDQSATLILGSTDERPSPPPSPGVQLDDARRGPDEGENLVVLGDTIGELRKFYAMASVVFVGRSLIDLGHRQHGSDMIEPAALGKPVVVGPFTSNFAEPMNYFQAAGAIRIVQNAQELETAIENLLADSAGANTMGAAAREVVKAQQGATRRHVKLILDTLDSVPTMSRR